MKIVKAKKHEKEITIDCIENGSLFKIGHGQSQRIDEELDFDDDLFIKVTLDFEYINKNFKNKLHNGTFCFFASLKTGGIEYIPSDTVVIPDNTAYLVVQ